jgi:hypothetical protein
MLDHATFASGPRAISETSATSDASTRSLWLYRILPLLLFLAVVLTGVIRYRQFLMEENGYIPAAFAIVLSVILSLLPAMICVVHNTTRRRQLSRLGSLEKYPVGQSQYYQAAVISVDGLRVGTIDADYGPPLFIYFLIVFLGFVAFLVGYKYQAFFNIPSVMLAGLKPVADQDLNVYQQGTYCVLATAFIASYIYSLGRLIDRVNNNDLYPISLYIYAAHIVIACAVAGVVRHTAHAFGADSTSVLLLLAFAIGFAPDLFIVAILRHAFQIMKVWGNRAEPTGKLPTALPLLMIDDLSRDKIDRLGELGIDSAQVLARQNPFLLLTRLPYDLALLVDWIGQAQLYVLVKDDKLDALRNIFVRDCCDLYLQLCCDTSRASVAAALGISDADTQLLRKKLEQDPSFMRLREVRAALVPATIQ